MAASGSHRRCTMPSAVLHSIAATSSGPHAFGDEPPRAIDVRVRHRAARVGLERDVGAEPNPARAVEHRAEVAAVAVGEGVEETMLAIEQRPRAGEACLRHARGAIAGLRRPARMHPLGPRAFGEVFDDARCHASGDAERVDPLRFSSRSSAVATPAAAPSAPNTAVGWNPALCTSLGAGRQRRHITSHPTAMPRAQVAAGKPMLLGGGEQRRNDHRARVHGPALERVVVVLAVRGGAVAQCRGGDVESARMPDQRAPPGSAVAWSAACR